MSQALTPDTVAAVSTEPADGVGEVPVHAPLSPHVTLKRVIMLINPLSGGVGPNAMAEAREILADYDLEVEVETLDHDFDDVVDRALASKPDALLVLAGDGTAGMIATRAGSGGPLVAPLPGGTMNMLPRALYGPGDWQSAMRLALSEGAAVTVSGGVVDKEHVFYCAAILGSPALWAPAREAVRTGRLKLAWTYARRALRRAFSGRLRHVLDGGDVRRAEAMVFICPMISRAMDEPVGLEAAAMNTANAGEAFRLAAHAVLNDWRDDPAVRTQPVRMAEMRGRSRIPAVIDGEPVLLGRSASVSFRPRAFRALAPLPPTGEDGVRWG